MGIYQINMWEKTNFPKVACSLASLILLENDLKLSEENFEKIFNSSSVKVEAFWFSWFFTKLVKEDSQFSKQNDIEIDSTGINHNDQKKKNRKRNRADKRKRRRIRRRYGIWIIRLNRIFNACIFVLIPKKKINLNLLRNQLSFLYDHLRNNKLYFFLK